MIHEQTNLINALISLDDASEDQLLNICFSDPLNIDKAGFIAFLKKTAVSTPLSDAEKTSMLAYIAEIENKESEFIKFVGLYIAELRSKGRIPRFNSSHWALMSVAMKKCLPIQKADAKIDDFDGYISLFDDVITDQQIDAHKICFDALNNNANAHSLKNLVGLSDYLFKHWKPCKRTKTCKKNIRRVERKTKKIMLTYKLSMIGRQDYELSYGRHHVPAQVRTRIIKLFLLEKK